MNSPFLKSTPSDETVVIEGVFQAAISRVYQAWTEPDEMIKWFGPSENSLLSVTCDLSVGGKFCLEHKTVDNFRSTIEGQYLEIEPNQKLVFSWSHMVTRLDGTKTTSPISKVTVLFIEVGAATTIRLTHEDIVQSKGRSQVSLGWSATFARLRTLVNTWNSK